MKGDENWEKNIDDMKDNSILLHIRKQRRKHNKGGGMVGNMTLP